MKMKWLNTVFTPDFRLIKFKQWFAVGCLLLMAIIYLSFSSSTAVPMTGNLDKLYHALAYYFLMLWWLQLFPKTLARSMLALLFIIMSGGIEFLQSFHPLRYMDWWDLAANSAGIVAAVLLGFTGLDQLLYKFERRIWQ